MEKAAACLTMAIMLLVAGRYSWLIWKRKVEPVLSTWLLFFIATALSLWTYWSREQHSLTSNIANLADMFVVTAILLSIICFGKEVSLGFKNFELWCFASSGIILILWRLSEWHVVSNFMLQGILAVGYVPTFIRLLKAQKNTEAFEIWIGVWLASLIAILPAFQAGDWVAIVYPARALLSASVMIGLMLRLVLFAKPQTEVQ